MDIQGLLTNLVPIVTIFGWLLTAYVVLLWAASVLWTYRDIHERSEDVLVQVLAVSLALLLPFAGLLLHLLLRPRRTLTERYERRLEEEYLRRDMDDPFVCPNCQRTIETDFVICPHCHTSLRRRCGSCQRTIDLTWSICPYCGDDGAGNVLSAPYPKHNDAERLQLYER